MVFQERQPLIKTGHGWWRPRAVNLMEERFGNRTAKSELVILVGDETEVCVLGGGVCGGWSLFKNDARSWGGQRVRGNSEDRNRAPERGGLPRSGLGFPRSGSSAAPAVQVRCAGLSLL